MVSWSVKGAGDPLPFDGVAFAWTARSVLKLPLGSPVLLAGDIRKRPAKGRFEQQLIAQNCVMVPACGLPTFARGAA